VPEPVLLSSVPGGDAARASIWLFGGSTPADGPLNDLFALHVRRAAGAGEGAALQPPLELEWEEVATRGPAPAPRELHNAFVRPAVLERVGGAGAGAEAGDERALVRVLQPAVLVVHGGRNEENEGRPRADICVLDLHSRTWLGAAARSPFACAAGAFAQAGGGSGGRLPVGFVFGGQDKDAEINGALVALDLSCGLLAAAGGGGGCALVAEGSPRALAALLEPCNLVQRWALVPMRAAPEPEARFAAAAACEEDESGGLLVFCFGGMGYTEDFAELLCFRIEERIEGD
jgi:hypothetical protein